VLLQKQSGFLQLESTILYQCVKFNFKTFFLGGKFKKNIYFCLTLLLMKILPKRHRILKIFIRSLINKCFISCHVKYDQQKEIRGGCGKLNTYPQTNDVT
jgi:hypothetical protein